MKELFTQYKPFFLFLARFLGSYILLLIVYKIYLSNYIDHPDGITYLVAKQSHWLLNFMGHPSSITPLENWVNLYCGPHNFYVRIVEGCNAISVIILFSSFCIAFSAYLGRTIIYVLIGSFFIYLFNIFRIALIVILVLKYPMWQRFLHDILFPVLIYGFVFILWCLWLFKFSGYAKKYFISK